jgi:NADH dehydrogenase
MPGVHAIGDVSAFITDDLPRGLPGVAPVAQQQGHMLQTHSSNNVQSTNREIQLF